MVQSRATSRTDRSRATTFCPDRDEFPFLSFQYGADQNGKGRGFFQAHPVKMTVSLEKSDRLLLQVLSKYPLAEIALGEQILIQILGNLGTYFL